MPIAFVNSNTEAEWFGSPATLNPGAGATIILDGLSILNSDNSDNPVGTWRGAAATRTGIVYESNNLYQGSAFFNGVPGAGSGNFDFTGIVNSVRGHIVAAYSGTGAVPTAFAAARAFDQDVVLTVPGVAATDLVVGFLRAENGRNYNPGATGAVIRVDHTDGNPDRHFYLIELPLGQATFGGTLDIGGSPFDPSTWTLCAMALKAPVADRLYRRIVPTQRMI